MSEMCDLLTIFKNKFRKIENLTKKCVNLEGAIKFNKTCLKGVISKFWNFLYYWSDLTEIFTQYVKLNKKHFLFLNIFPFRA